MIHICSDRPYRVKYPLVHKPDSWHWLVKFSILALNIKDWIIIEKKNTPEIFLKDSAKKNEDY